MSETPPKPIPAPPRSPSRRDFMRSRRPGKFSDSTTLDEPQLDRSLLEFQLDSLTSRSQELLFENFCRKLLQRTICPNLLPHTGPTGGGDSKVDTETYPVAHELSVGWYIGTTAAGTERWAFAISAKKAWPSKVAQDIKKAVETERNYTKFFFVSNQAIPDKKRAAKEDELRKLHGVDVRIFDRTWILDSVFDNKLQTLAIDELALSGILRPRRLLGPNDAARERDLVIVEQRIQEALRENKHGSALADDCLESALLARSLERPRTDVDGLFLRAQRVASRCGTKHQQLLTYYEHAWATLYWFDDLTSFSALYPSVEALAKDSLNVYDLELLSNLCTSLRGAVAHDRLDPKDYHVEERLAVLRVQLERLAADEFRPSAALQARTLLLLGQVVGSPPGERDEALRALERVVVQSDGLVGYPLTPLVSIVTELGDVLSGSTAFESLFETIVASASRREGEVAGARLLLERGIQQLDQEKPYAAIRTLGRALVRLYKHETRREIVLALFQCGVAYERVGLLWAARGSFLVAASIASNDLWTYGDATVSQGACYERMKWIELRLGRLPHVLAWHELASMITRALEARGHKPRQPMEADVHFGAVLGVLLLRSDPSVLKRLEQLPDVLTDLGLEIAAAALLFALGHVGRLPAELLGGRREEAVLNEFFSAWVLQPAAHDIAQAPLLLDTTQVSLASDILGCHLSVEVDNVPACTDLAESLLAALEAMLATALKAHVVAREPSLAVRIQADRSAAVPFEFESAERLGRPEVHIRCADFDPQQLTVSEQAVLKERMFEVITLVLARAFFLPDTERTLTVLFGEERANDRALNFTSSFVVLRNVLGSQPKTAMAHWLENRSPYPLKRATPWMPVQRPTTTPSTPKPRAGESTDVQAPGPDSVTHKQVRVLSLIRESLWNRAQWYGTLFQVSRIVGEPPVLSPIFRDKEAARDIFLGLREDLGNEDTRNALHITFVRGVLSTNPHAYRVAIGSNPATDPGAAKDQLIMMVVRMNTMEPHSGENLQNFLDAYHRVGRYLLAPAVLTATGVAVASGLAILKRDLGVRDAWTIGRHDPDCVALRRDDTPLIPEGRANAPVLELLTWLRSLPLEQGE